MTESDAELFGEDFERAQSKRMFRRGDLITKPEPGNFGLDALDVYRGKRRILHCSVPHEHLWLALPYPENRARPIHSFDGGREDFIKNKTRPTSVPFTDFNGDGVPDLIVAQTIGNAGLIYKIYSLGKHAKLLGRIDAVRCDAEFVDIDHDGRCDALAFDSAFFGWKTCNAYSPYPLLILEMGRRGLEPSIALMKTRPPTKEHQEKILARWVNACREHRENSDDNLTFYLEHEVWSDMLDLIYSGNSKVAFDLLDRFWREGTYASNLEWAENCAVVRTSKEGFTRMFLQQLRHSKYLDAIKQLNPDDPRIHKLGPSLATPAFDY